MLHDNVSVVLRWFDEVWNQRRTETIDELMGDESVCYMGDDALRGSDEFRQRQYEPLLSAFPDIQVQVDGIIANDNQVVVRWTATGTHTGEGLQIAATQKRVSFTGMTWIRIRDGKLAEGWQASNIDDVIRKLADPAPVA